MTTAADPFARAREVADAVLFEGYLLYPYRASAAKNQVRWQWGVLLPPGYSTADTGREPSAVSTQFLLDPGSEPRLAVRLRFLQVVHRQVLDPAGHPVASLEADGEMHLTYDEGRPREVDVTVDAAGTPPVSVPVDVPAGEERVALAGGGQVIRRTWPLSGRLTVAVDRLPGPYGTVRVTVRVENTSLWAEGGAAREEALRHSLVATHALLAATGGRFLSLLDPPEWAAAYPAECSSEGLYPVFVDDQSLLCSPIILYDQPQVAPESPTSLFDATEIDEILTLRTLALTDAEKAEARATDPRAAELIDRVDTMPAEVLERLHGAVRYLRAATSPGVGGVPSAGPPPLPVPDAPWWDPGADTSVSPETDTVEVSGQQVGRGTRVLLRPGSRRADAQDAFLAGRTGRVEAVLFDVDGGTHLAVSLADDPLAELAAGHGRFLYFAPDELEPLP